MALRDQLSHRSYLAEPLTAELEDRNARRRKRCIREARFPRLTCLAGLELAAAPSVDPVQFSALERGAWIDAAGPIAVFGDSGTASHSC